MRNKCKVFAETVDYTEYVISTGRLVLAEPTTDALHFPLLMHIAF